MGANGLSPFLQVCFTLHTQDLETGSPAQRLSIPPYATWTRRPVSMDIFAVLPFGSEATRREG